MRRIITEVVKHPRPHPELSAKFIISDVHALRSNGGDYRLHPVSVGRVWVSGRSDRVLLEIGNNQLSGRLFSFLQGAFLFHVLSYALLTFPIASASKVRAFILPAIRYSAHPLAKQANCRTGASCDDYRQICRHGKLV